MGSASEPAYSKGMDIVIVGGSLCGLFAGVALKSLNQGHKIRILERQANALQDQGAGIGLGSYTAEFFARYDKSQSPIALTQDAIEFAGRLEDVTNRNISPVGCTSWELVFNVLRWNFDGGHAPGFSFSDLPPPDADPQGSASYTNGCNVQAVREHTLPSGKAGMLVTYVDAAGAEQSTTADLVLGADGPGSTIRRLVDPSATRDYCGYVAYRGKVPETEVSEESRAAFGNNILFFRAKGTQAVCYLIPGTKGALEKDQRMLNWAWYCNYPEGSPEWKQLMTDTDGRTHHVSLPVGKINPEVVARQKQYAAAVLSPPFAEVVHKTEQPFIQAITDARANSSLYFGGKLLLLGDALAGLRPHTASSTAQAAFNCMLLADVFNGKISLDDWQRQTMDYAVETSKLGINMGNGAELGHHEAYYIPAS